MLVWLGILTGVLVLVLAVLGYLYYKLRDVLSFTSNLQVNNLLPNAKVWHTPYDYRPLATILPVVRDVVVIDVEKPTLTRDYKVLQDEILTDPTKLGYSQYLKDYDTLAKLLNTPSTTANSKEAQLVPRQLSIYELFSCVTVVEALEIYKNEALERDIETSVKSNDRAAMTALLTIISSLLTKESQDKIATLLAQTEPDPTYSAELTGDSRATTIGWPGVNPSDVQIALHLSSMDHAG